MEHSPPYEISWEKNPTSFSRLKPLSGACLQTYIVFKMLFKYLNHVFLFNFTRVCVSCPLPYCKLLKANSPHPKGCNTVPWRKLLYWWPPRKHIWYSSPGVVPSHKDSGFLVWLALANKTLTSIMQVEAWKALALLEPSCHVKKLRLDYWMMTERSLTLSTIPTKTLGIWARPS